MSMVAVRRILAVALAAAALAGTARAQQARPALKVGVVDLEKVLAGSKAGLELTAKLRQMGEASEAELNRGRDELAALQDRLGDGRTSLSAERLSELKKEIETQGIALERLRADRLRQQQQVSDEGISVIESELQPVLLAVRERGGYDLLLNNVPGIVIFAGAHLNLTAEVIAALDAELPSLEGAAVATGK